MGKFEELLATYGKTVDEVTFEYENLSDEELEVAFKEAFEDESKNENVSDDNITDDDSQTDNDVSGDNIIDNNGADKTDGEPEKFTKTFTVELSHDDIRNALYTLIRQYETEDEYFYIREVFGSYFVMQDWWNNKIYKQNYVVDEENVSLDGDKIEVYEILVTKEEKDALDALKENYSALETKYNELVEFKSNVEAIQIQAQKDAIFAKEEFACVIETKAFKKLIERSKDYTVEECEQRAKDILDDCNDYIASFSAKDVVNKPKVIGVNFSVKDEKKKKAYGNLFD